MATTTIVDLAARLRAAREDRGLSIEGAAAQARVGADTWAGVEEFGAIACHPITLCRILDWLDQ